MVTKKKIATPKKTAKKALKKVAKPVAKAAVKAKASAKPKAKPTAQPSIESLASVKRHLTPAFLKSEELIKEEWERAIVLTRDGLGLVLFDADKTDPDVVRGLFDKLGKTGLGLLAFSRDTEKIASVYLDENKFLELHGFNVGPTRLRLALKNLFWALRLERDQSRATEGLRESHEELKELNRVGVALSGERDIDKLLGLIVERARFITSSDAGSLYIIEDGEGGAPRKMRFKIAQNDSLKISFSEFSLPIDKKSIAGFVAATGQTLNIDDAYLIPKETEYQLNKSFDERNGYRSKSMLTVAMKNRSGEIIGVLQLMNRKRRRDIKIVPAAVAEREVLPYTQATVQLVESLASQAAVSLENAFLYDEIQKLFESFVRASVTAIESRDPTTHGHSNRVATLTVGLAEAADKADEAYFKNVKFTKKDLKEIEYAGLLHDFGKIGVREEVLVKAKKLYPWDWDMLRARFDFIRRTMEKDHLKRKLDYVMKYGVDKAREEFDTLEKLFMAEMATLDEDLSIIEASNLPTVLPEGGFDKIREISGKYYDYIDGTKRPFLLQNETFNLSLPKGSLNDGERIEIESHVSHTFQYLQKIHWGKTYKDVPYIAYAHHEKLNGKGYPRHLSATEIPLQSKMMAISDIFDALTASDRPYKKAVPTQRALDILGMEVKDGFLDANIFKLFIDARVYEKTVAAKP